MLMQLCWPLLTMLPLAETVAVYQDWWEGVFLGGGWSWGLVRMWSRDRGNIAQLFHSRSSHSCHSHSSHDKQSEAGALSGHIKLDFQPFPPCSSTSGNGWIISVRFICQMDEIGKQHRRLSAALLAAACYERPGGWSLEIWSALRSGKMRLRGQE